MPEEKLPRVGDRVNVDGRVGVFFVLDVDRGAHSVTLLPSDTGRRLDKIPVETLAILPRPESNGAMTA